MTRFSRQKQSAQDVTRVSKLGPPVRRPLSFELESSQAQNLNHQQASPQDWQLTWRSDLEKPLMFPQHIVKATLRPDITLVSESRKTIIILELKVPREDRLEGGIREEKGQVWGTGRKQG